MSFKAKLAQKTQVPLQKLEAIISMVEDGASIPFMARYRKEKTGGLDEIKLREVVEGIETSKELLKRRESMFKSLLERDLLTDPLKRQLNEAEELKELEELYNPYRPKRKTRASLAKELGLEPLAKEVYQQHKRQLKAEAFLSDQLKDIESVWSGVTDIIAEYIADTVPLRRRLFELLSRRGVFISKVIKKKQLEASKYSDYFDHRDLFHKIPAHRLHAMLRGKNEGFLRLSLEAQSNEAIQTIQRMVIKGHGPDKKLLETAIQDAWQRLIQPSLENELIHEAKQKADFEAIDVFAKNLKTLLMEAPLGSKKVLAIDPGFRTGCKAICLDSEGKFLYNQTIYPFASAQQIEAAKTWIRDSVQKENIDIIAIGNGTAGRETEAFVKSLELNCAVVQVSESGASIYSASEVARHEFPDLDLTVRGAISIGRRLQDPLAELVKLDPKSIGVGQYQHDVDQKALQHRLNLEIESCVNGVGVELNTASAKLLTYVSGLGPKLAESIIEYRDQNGSFSARKDLLKVPRLGAKAYEQCAGFIRIRNASNPLDASGVHPECYSIVQAMAKDQNADVVGLINNPTLIKSVNLNDYVSESVGLPTLNDIMEELAKPGRDPRPSFELFQFNEKVQKPEDLIEGMELPGIVTNVTKFGAFVDIGVHQDGLVHISQMADHFVDDPNKIVSVQQKVNVWVTQVDLGRKRIGLSMKGPINLSK